MKCPHCSANLETVNSRGETVLKNRGLIFKSQGISLACPKCKQDVPVSNENMNKMHRVAVLFLQR